MELKLNTNATIDKIIVENEKAIGVISNGIEYRSDIVLSGADYHHTETLFLNSTDNTRKITGIKKLLHLLPYYFM